MKIVLDTNLLVSGIFWGGTPLKILDLWKKKSIELLASDATLNEYLSTILKIAERMDRADLFRSWSLVLPARLYPLGSGLFQYENPFGFAGILTTIFLSTARLPGEPAIL